MRTLWDQAVMLACRSNGELFVVTSTIDAFELLMNDWPTTKGRAFKVALEICASALSDARDDRSAREAFIKAAVEAGMSTLKVSATTNDVFVGTVH